MRQDHRRWADRPRYQELYYRWKANESHYVLAAEYGFEPETARNIIRYFERGAMGLNAYWKKHGTRTILAKTDRNIEIAQRYEAGETGSALGAEFGICRERVRQIWARIYQKKSEKNFGQK